MIGDLEKFLRKRLELELPGERAHIEMAPIRRPMAEEARHWKDTRHSAVLVLLYPYGGKINTVLMRRPDTGGVHSKQVSFPGGGRDETDEHIHDSALREAEEEMGIARNSVRVAGKLSDLYIPPSKSLVTPVIGFSSSRPDFVPDGKEVDEVIETDVFDLFEDKHFRKTELVTSRYLLKEVPAFIYRGYTIWGATAMILNEFKWLLREFGAARDQRNFEKA